MADGSDTPRIRIISIIVDDDSNELRIDDDGFSEPETYWWLQRAIDLVWNGDGDEAGDEDNEID